MLFRIAEVSQYSLPSQALCAWASGGYSVEEPPFSTFPVTLSPGGAEALHVCRQLERRLASLWGKGHEQEIPCS